jgi:hypothetical protein
MGQKVSWPAAILAIAALLLLVGLLYHRAADSGTGPRISPQFQQLSPAEQKAALDSAERARRRRGSTE